MFSSPFLSYNAHEMNISDVNEIAKIRRTRRLVIALIIACACSDGHTIRNANAIANETVDAYDKSFEITTKISIAVTTSRTAV